MGLMIFDGSFHALKEKSIVELIMANIKVYNDISERKYVDSPNSSPAIIANDKTKSLWLIILSIFCILYVFSSVIYNLKF